MREVDKYFDIIKEAQAKIDQIQSECKHVETYEGKYMWRIGSIMDMMICKECSKALYPIIRTATTEIPGYTSEIFFNLE